jgi:3-oxoacyl-[acyl-carrier-protein] synthase II
LRPSAAVTGIGLITPLGAGAEETWNGFLHGKCGIRKVDLFDSGRYPSPLGGQIDRNVLHGLFSAAEAAHYDAGSLLPMAAAREAFEQAGLTRSDLERMDRTALVLGSTLGGMPRSTQYIRAIREQGYARARGSLLREIPPHTQADILCRRWGLRGESLIISDACTSGTNALGYALNLLRRGDADLVVAGGYDPMSEFAFAGFHSLMNISPGMARPFDRDRKGLVLGEGAAILVLEREEDAKKRGAEIRGRILGYGESADGFHITRPDPEARGAALALRRALDDAEVPATDVGHINAHGTGTTSNDPMEAKAVRDVFAPRAEGIPLTSNKGAIGHTLGAAGAVEAAVALLALRDQVVPPTLHHENLDPDCAGIDVVRGEPRTRAMTCAVSNSFGFGGANAAVVLGKA